MINQTNDTGLHPPVRKELVQRQTEITIKKTRESGGGVADLAEEENIDIVIDIMRNRNLHIKACKGYKYTGTTVAFDGSEDKLICREAKHFWDEMKMRTQIDSAVAHVKGRYEAGELT